MSMKKPQRIPRLMAYDPVPIFNALRKIEGDVEVLPGVEAVDILDMAEMVVHLSRIAKVVANVGMWDCLCGGPCDYNSEGEIQHGIDCLVYVCSSWKDWKHD